jgi:hypothetical protein
LKKSRAGTTYSRLVKKYRLVSLGDALQNPLFSFLRQARHLDASSFRNRFPSEKKSFPNSLFILRTSSKAHQSEEPRKESTASLLPPSQNSPAKRERAPLPSISTNTATNSYQQSAHAPRPPRIRNHRLPFFSSRRIPGSMGVL